jgi:AbrB family transcriptional regulator (stage V sporulation protein T)
MKATGIVRNLDALRRVVIPIEICRSYGLKPGDPVEVFTEDGGHIILRKFSIEGHTVDALNVVLDQLEGVNTSGAVEIRRHVAAVKNLLPDALKEGGHI